MRARILGKDKECNAEPKRDRILSEKFCSDVVGKMERKKNGIRDYYEE